MGPGWPSSYICLCCLVLRNLSKCEPLSPRRMLPLTKPFLVPLLPCHYGLRQQLKQIVICFCPILLQQ